MWSNSEDRRKNQHTTVSGLRPRPREISPCKLNLKLSLFFGIYGSVCVFAALTVCMDFGSTSGTLFGAVEPNGVRWKPNTLLPLSYKNKPLRRLHNQPESACFVQKQTKQIEAVRGANDLVEHMVLGHSLIQWSSFWLNLQRDNRDDLGWKK